MGLEGETRLQVITDDPDGRFVKGATFLCGDTSDGVSDNQRGTSASIVSNFGGTLTLENIRQQGKSYIAKFAQINDRTAAEQLQGTEIFIETQGSQNEDEQASNEFYYDELVGLEVRNLSGERLGEIVGVIGNANNFGQDLLEVKLGVLGGDNPLGEGVASAPVVSDNSQLSTSAGGDFPLKKNNSKNSSKKVLIPFVRQIVPTVDIVGGFVVIDPPGGLLEL